MFAGIDCDFNIHPSSSPKPGGCALVALLASLRVFLRHQCCWQLAVLVCTPELLNLVRLCNRVKAQSSERYQTVRP